MAFDQIPASRFQVPNFALLGVNPPNSIRRSFGRSFGRSFTSTSASGCVLRAAVIVALRRCVRCNHSAHLGREPTLCMLQCGTQKDGGLLYWKCVVVMFGWLAATGIATCGLKKTNTETTRVADSKSLQFWLALFIL